MVKINRTLVILFMVLAVFLLSVCSKKKSTKPEPEPPKYKWTILGYFDGNNEQDLDILTNGSYVIQDVQEMEQVGSTEEVQVIVMLGSVKTKGNCNYYLIGKHLDEPPNPDSIRSEVLDSLGPEDMSDPETLKDFIKYGVENYPAEHYMLIINDHGFGWKGVCSDQQNGGGQMMSLLEFSSVLSGHKFDIILFNAPSMSMLEVAYQLKDKANYLVASQFPDPMRNILGSSQWLQQLTNNPNLSSRSLARNIVIAIESVAFGEVEFNISAIDLSKVGALTSKVRELGSLLLTNTGDYWKEVVNARKWSVHFLPYYFDLKNFSSNIQTSPHLDSTVRSAARDVENARVDAVVEMKSAPDLGYGGICIHFPLKAADFDSTRYVQLDFAVSGWHVFLSWFIQAYAEANTGSLWIISFPVKGATIYLDGEYTDFKTDAIIHGIPAGVYTVKLVKEGYTTREYTNIPVFVGETTKRELPFY